MRDLLFGGMAAATVLVPTVGGARDCDPVAGERLFTPCKHCHRLDRDGAGPKSGPYLSGIVGRPAAAAEDFRYYSDAMKAYAAAGGVWDDARLVSFLQNPQQEVPGTKMLFLGVPDAGNRDDLVCYLETLR